MLTQHQKETNLNRQLFKLKQHHAANSWLNTYDWFEYQEKHNAIIVEMVSVCPDVEYAPYYETYDSVEGVHQYSLHNTPPYKYNPEWEILQGLHYKGNLINTDTFLDLMNYYSRRSEWINEANNR